MKPEIFQKRMRGWSRSELLVVLGTISVLLLLAVPLVSQTRSNGTMAGCLNHLKQLTVGWQLYATDNEGELVGAGNGPAGSPPEWSGGAWLDFISRPTIDPELSIKRSALWPYVQKTEAWRCPADLSSSYFAGLGWRPRVRSYSMNCWMGGPGWGNSGVGWKVFKKITDIKEPKPAEAWVLIDEREDGINDGLFGVDMLGYPDFPRSVTLVDYPANRHENGAGVSFADGHAEIWIWKDARTTPRISTGQSLPVNVASPNNRDIIRLQQASTRR